MLEDDNGGPLVSPPSHHAAGAACVDGLLTVAGGSRPCSSPDASNQALPTAGAAYASGPQARDISATDPLLAPSNHGAVAADLDARSDCASLAADLTVHLAGRKGASRAAISNAAASALQPPPASASQHPPARGAPRPAHAKDSPQAGVQGDAPARAAASARASHAANGAAPAAVNAPRPPHATGAKATSPWAAACRSAPPLTSPAGDALPHAAAPSFAQVLLNSVPPPAIPIAIHCPASTDSGEPAAFFTPEEINLSCKLLEHAIVAKTPLGRPAFQDIRLHFVQRFQLKQDFLLSALDGRHLLMRFQNEEDYLQVLLKESLYVKGKPF